MLLVMLVVLVMLVMLWDQPQAGEERTYPALSEGQARMCPAKVVFDNPNVNFINMKYIQRKIMNERYEIMLIVHIL